MTFDEMGRKEWGRRESFFGHVKKKKKKKKCRMQKGNNNALIPKLVRRCSFRRSGGKVSKDRSMGVVDKGWIGWKTDRIS